MKTCSYLNCNNPVFSKGECRYHYRYIPKKKKYAKKASPETQVELFTRIWSTRSHHSEISGEPLEKYASFWLNLFMHVLPKGKYPKFKYLEENIMLGTPEEHRLLDQGTEKQREEHNKNAQFPADWQKFYDKQKKLKIKYREY